MPAIHQDERTHGNAWGLHVHQDEADPFLAFLGLAVGAHQAKNPVAIVAQGSPYFLAVDHVMVALALGPGFNGGQVGACARLRITLHPKIIAFANTGQELVFLGGRAKFQQHRSAHGRAKRRQTGRTGQGKLFVVDIALGNVPTGAAPFHRPMRHRPAFGRQNFVPTQIVLFRQSPIALHFVAQVSR